MFFVQITVDIWLNFFSIALVNKGNVIFKKGDYEKAREFFREALQNDSSCIEALYNLGKFICNQPTSC